MFKKQKNIRCIFVIILDICSVCAFNSKVLLLPVCLYNIVINTVDIKKHCDKSTPSILLKVVIIPTPRLIPYPKLCKGYNFRKPDTSRSIIGLIPYIISRRQCCTVHCTELQKVHKLRIRTQTIPVPNQILHQFCIKLEL